MIADGPALFAFAQVEVPWQLGPDDGRYVLRPDGEPDAQVTQVIVLATLGAAQRRHLGVRRPRGVDPEPEPTAVTTGRATIVFSDRPLADCATAKAWLRGAGENELAAGLLALNRMLSAFRRVAADPYAVTVGRHQLIAARIGYGAGEQVADGRWEQARELPGSDSCRRRARVLAPQARLAAALGARQTTLVCEELALRARLDLDQDRPREASLQLLVTLDAAVAELAREPEALGLSERVAELRGRRPLVAGAAQAALGAVPSPEQLELVRSTVQRLEAALRARAIALSRDPAPR
jgi:hypothetical protein